jgi:4-hydroxybenzoate polyprenyltransferase
MRMDKPIGIFLLLWPTYWGLFFAAAGRPSWSMIMIFTSGIVLMRAAGCVINDMADSDFDGGVARTCSRPLVTGELSQRQAMTVFALLMLAAFSLACLLNALAFRLAFVGAALACIYPFSKRFFHCPQLLLGLAFSWGIPMAFAAQTGGLPLASWWLFAISAIWAIIYDTQYAMVDREDDLKIGIYSSAILFGRADRWLIALLQAVMMSLWGGFAWYYQLGQWFWLSWAMAIVLCVWQLRLIWARERGACFRAFLSNHWLGLMLFVGLLVSL